MTLRQVVDWLENTWQQVTSEADTFCESGLTRQIVLLVLSYAGYSVLGLCLRGMRYSVRKTANFARNRYASMFPPPSALALHVLDVLKHKATKWEEDIHKLSTDDLSIRFNDLLTVYALTLDGEDAWMHLSGKDQALVAKAANKEVKSHRSMRVHAILNKQAAKSIRIVRG